MGTKSLSHYRCFLFLVNYSRAKPEVALKALPFLIDVGVILYAWGM